MDVSLSNFLQLTAGSSVLAAIFNHLFTRREMKAKIDQISQKTPVEIEKMRAETEKTAAEVEKIRTETQKTAAEIEKMRAETEKLSYRLPESSHPTEAILFSIDSSDGHDFRWVNLDKSEGDVEVKEGILYIRRKNTVGTLQVWFEGYRYRGRSSLPKLPKNEEISGDRKLRVSCEVKAIGGEHTLLFLFKGENDPPGMHLAERRERVTSNEWASIEAYFRIPPAKNCQMRIDDRSVTGQGVVQIRRLVLAERVTSVMESGAIK